MCAVVAVRSLPALPAPARPLGLGPRPSRLHGLAFMESWRSASRAASAPLPAPPPRATAYEKKAIPPGRRLRSEYPQDPSALQCILRALISVNGSTGLGSIGSIGSSGPALVGRGRHTLPLGCGDFEICVFSNCDAALENSKRFRAFVSPFRGSNSLRPHTARAPTSNQGFPLSGSAPGAHHSRWSGDPP